MSENFSLKKHKKLHFTGVLGVSMSGLAKHLCYKNYQISGSDGNKNGDFDALKNLGITTFKGHAKRFVKGADALIVSSAVDEKNPELKYAKSKNIPVVKRSILLGEIISDYKTSVCVSGSHGKTTATAMIADIMILAKKDPTVFLGGNSQKFGNYRNGGDDFVLAEACEYKKNFLDLKPKIAVVLNIDNDHLDSYKDMNDMVNAFNRFIKSSVAVINADDKYSTLLESDKSVTFGVEKSAVYTAKNIKLKDKGYQFTAYAYSKPLGKITLSIMGKHNIYNALSAIAVADTLKIPFSVIKKALEEFVGVERRTELIGMIDKCSVYADYAHHPKEINASILAFSDFNQDFAVIFQPHTYSRTRLLMADFVIALKKVQDIAIYKTYPAREKFDERGSETALFEQLIKTKTHGCKLVENQNQLIDCLCEFSKRYPKIIVLGAGDIYDLVKKAIKTISC